MTKGPGGLCMLLAAALLAAFSCGAAVRGQSVEQRRREIKEQIMPRVARLRGIDYTREVPVKTVTPREVEAHIRKSIAENMSDEEFDGYRRMLVYLGLVRPDVDLKEVIIKAYSQQVAGYYDDDAKSFSVVQNSKDSGALDTVTIAHELTHALQDQRFDLSAMQDFTEHNDDADLAVSALVEGDASELMLRYATGAAPRGHGPVKDYTAFMSLSLGPESIPGLPLILTQDMMFPYTYGTRFATEVLKEAGAEGLDMAFADPPVSTEQVIEPSKYFRREEPYLIELPDLSQSLDKGWRRVDQEPLGQFELGIYLSVTTGTWGVDKAISGWRGDMLAGYAGPAGDDFFIVYASTWDSYEDALEFADRYARLIETRFPDAKLAHKDANVTFWKRGDNLYYLKRLGPDVLVIENIPAEFAPNAIIASWAAPKVPFGIERPIADRERIQPEGSFKPESAAKKKKAQSKPPENEPLLRVY